MCVGLGVPACEVVVGDDEAAFCRGFGGLVAFAFFGFLFFGGRVGVQVVFG